MSLSIKIYDPSSERYYELQTDFHPASPYFIRTQDGEGMGMSAKQLFDKLDKWFEENM